MWSSQLAFEEITDRHLDQGYHRAQQIAENVAACSLQAASYRLNVVGPRATTGEQANGQFISPGDVKLLVPTTHKQSYILNGLVDVTLRISGKINHLLVRDCQKTRIQLDRIISGVSILKSRKISLDVPVHNTTSLEEVVETDLYGQTTPETIFYISASLDINLNHQNLNITPFTRGVYRNGQMTNWPSQGNIQFLVEPSPISDN